MRWIRERDAVIAQTMAFVQSVTGRKLAAQKADFELSTMEPEIEAAPLPENPILEPIVEPPETQTSQTSPPSDFATTEYQKEIRARVANFRAHQERFNREREEYCSATLAKLRADLNSSPLPRVEK